MAKETSVSLVDDLDGGKAAETVTFGLDGSSYEIDLSKKNAAALRKALTQFVDHGRHVKVQSALTGKRNQKRPVPRKGTTPAVVREWAAGQGIGVSARGRVAADVIAQYEAATA